MIRYPKRRESKFEREIAGMRKRLIASDPRLAEWERSLYGRIEAIVFAGVK